MVGTHRATVPLTPFMDPQQRQHVHDDLKGIVKGELLFDDIARALYSSDASIFEVMPLGVVLPRDEEDVRAWRATPGTIKCLSWPAARGPAAAAARSGRD